MAQDDIIRLKKVLLEKLNECSAVFLTGHNKPNIDFDSIASCVGMQDIITTLGVPSYIVIDDDSKIQAGVMRIVDRERGKRSFITKEEFQRLSQENPNNLLIVCDVNQKNRVLIGDCLDNIKEIIIIDHHSENESDFNTPHVFNESDCSSASEIVTLLMDIMNIQITGDTANYLLTGIHLDTGSFNSNQVSSNTYYAAGLLIDSGASIKAVSYYKLTDMKEDFIIYDLMLNRTKCYLLTGDHLLPIRISITSNDTNSANIYNLENFARVSVAMIDYETINAAFTFGFVSDERVYISARGKDLNVGSIMKKFGGGGDESRAGASFIYNDLEQVEKQILEHVKEFLRENGITPLEEPIEVFSSEKAVNSLQKRKIK